MLYTRAGALALIGAGLAGCSGGSSIKVGSKNFSEALFLGELYAAVLEKHGLHVQRKLSLGSTQIAMAAMQRGEIDLYPEYTGTALLVQLKLPPNADRKAVYDTVKREYEQRYAITWLDPSPFNNTQALASTQAVARRYNLRTLSDVGRAAPQLRLAVGPEFVKRPDGLPGLIKAYGGFRFKEVRQFDIGLRYQAILERKADVCVAFSTDGAILQYDLVVFDDDKRFFPPYQVAPVVRMETLKGVPEIKDDLNKIAPLLDDATIRRINLAIDGSAKREPADMAREFLQQHGLG